MTNLDRGSLVKIRDETHFYDHQIKGVRQMAKMGSLLLADDMGLGKSLQALTVAAIDFEVGRAKRVLVVAPASLKGNWAEEIPTHTHFTFAVLDGTPKQRTKQLETFDADILIVNYEQMIPHVSDFNRMSFDIAIYDEAHYMKNPKSKRTKAAQALVAARHLLLTGSPLLNQVNELWSLLHRIDPGRWPRYWTFVNRYAVWGGFQDREIVGVKNQAELHEGLKTVMIRRMKADALDLPEKQHIPIWFDLTPEQRTLYKQAVREMKVDLPGDPNGMELENALTRFLRLKQICGTTACLPGHADHSSKLDHAVGTKEAPGMLVNCIRGDEFGDPEPVVVFTQFRGVQEALATRLLAAGIDFRLLHGDVPASDRVPLVRAWAEDAQQGRPQVLIAMLQVAGVGLNMTAAKKAIFLDKLFVPKLNEQAEDRLHRIGSDKTQPVQIFEFLCRNTIEQRIELILKRKVKTFGQLVEDSKWKRRLYKELMEGNDL